MKNYGKKAMSVVLAVLMCLTVCILDWSALFPQTNAYTESPTHTFRFIIRQGWSLGGHYDGRDGNTTLEVWGKTKNGNGTESRIYSNGSLGGNWAYASGSSGRGDVYTGEFSSASFPTKARVGISICRNGIVYGSQSITSKITMQVKNAATNSWIDVDCFQFTFSSDTNSDGSGSTWKETTQSFTAGKPYAAKVATSNSESNDATTTKNVTLNATGKASKTESLAAYVYDQYNVIWTAAPSSWSVSGTVGCDCSLTGTGAREDNTLTMTATKYTRAKAAATVTATYGSLHHYWTVNITPTYKITYNVSGNGGTSAVPGPDNTANNTGSANVTYTIPSGTNYTAKKEKGSSSTGTWKFEGWSGSQSANSGTLPGSSITIDSYDDTLYAIFSKTGTATFYWYQANGTRKSSTDTKTVYNNATQYTFDVPKNSVPGSFAANGTTYTFAGWAIDSDTKTTEDLAKTATSSTRNIKNGNKTDSYAFYALYTGSVTLSYDNNGGSGQPASKTSELVLNCGASASAASNTSGEATFTINPDNVEMSREYASDFIGWNTSAKDDETAEYRDGTVTWAASSGKPATIKIKKDTKLYASYYFFRYNVKFFDYTGAIKKTETVKYNTSASAPAMKTNSADPDHVDSGSHYVFDHWEYTDGSLYADTDKLVHADNGHLFEVWGKYVGHKHLWGEPYNVQGEVSCTSGQTYWARCTVCDYARRFETDPLEHDYVLIGVSEPTCTKDGSWGKYVCQNCNDVLDSFTVDTNGDGVEDLTVTEANRVRKAPGHAYGVNNGGTWTYVDRDADTGEYLFFDEDTGDFLVEPAEFAATCTTAGYKYYECSVCGDVYRVGQIPATGHDWSTVEEIPATCTEGGHTAYTKCVNCSLFLEGVDEDTEALGHEYVLVEETDSTCTVKGHYAYYECSRCGEYFDLVDGEYVAIEDITVKDKILLEHDYQPSEENIPATCTEDGHIGAWICTMCGAVDPDHPGEVITAPGHDLPEEWSVYTFATCAAPGEKRKKCSRCEYYESEEIPALAHEQGEYVAEVPPTCTEEGYTEGYRCANCDGYYLAPTVIDPLGHEMETIPGRAPTCTVDGIPDCYKCTRCNKLFLDEAGNNEITGDVGVIPALNHNFTDWVTAVLPTDTEPGVEKRRCIRCGTVEERSIDPSGHNMTFFAAVEATCTASGNNAYYLCANCGGYFADEDGENALDFDTEVYIAALGHQLGEEPVESEPATCAAEGYKAYECSRCHNTVIETLPKISEHGEAIPYGEDIPATCAAPGQRAGTMCSLCGAVLTSPTSLPKLNHTPELTRRDAFSATCTDTGYTGNLYCSVCGLRIESGTVEEARGHHLGELIQVSAATCTEYGEKVRKCADCDYEESYETPVLGHQIVTDKAVAATCTAEGLTEGKHCSRCNAVLVEQQTIGAKGHNYEITVIEPTCTKLGKTVHTCTLCGDTYEDTYVGKVPHEEGAAATCTSPAVCANCGRSYGEALGHDYQIDAAASTASTCAVHGVTVYKCTRCSDTYSETLPLSEHHVIDESSVTVTYNSCTEPGVVTMTCAVCGKVFTGEEPAPGHNYENGVCTRCGEAQPGSTPDVTPTGSEKCEKCGLNHNGRTGLWKQDGFFCKIIAFFRNIFKVFSK